MMLAQVVVVDLGITVDLFGDLFQLRFGYGEGDQGAGASAAVFEHRADARQATAAFQLFEAGQYLVFAAFEGIGHGAIGFGAQRHAVLKAVDQAAAESIDMHVTTPSRARGW